MKPVTNGAAGLTLYLCLVVIIISFYQKVIEVVFSRFLFVRERLRADNHEALLNVSVPFSGIRPFITISST